MSADSTGQEIEFGRFVVQQAERRLLIDGRVAKLSTRAFDILVALIASDGRMVTKNELLDIVWPRQVVEEANIHVHVSALRKVLGREVISTVPGRGYRFIHPLQPDPSQDHEARVGATPAPATSPGNLAISLPALYGRTDELATVSALLEKHRLVTLVGTGGIGKTCLALAAAHAQRERWSDGVWFVDLAPVEDPDHVPTAVARNVGIGLPAHRDPTDELALALRSRSVLLLLDNAEHLREAATALATTLLARSTRLALLVTSRQALHLPQEQRFHVPPLAVPTDVAAADPRTFGAMALFEARAAAADPRFRLSDRNAAAVAEVCRHVDGVPLAIELAAARVQVLGVRGLRSGLLESLRVLGLGDPRFGPRHQTLRATFNWTHSLLSPIESKLLRRLAVFVGGFTLQLAQQVAADADARADVDGDPAALDAWGVLDALVALIDKSLVVADDADPPRYRLLEVTRAYALERLTEAGEADRLSARHADAVWGLFRQAEVAKNEQIRGALSMAEFLQRLAPEVDNLRAARAWSNGPSGSRPLAIGIAASSSEALRMLGLSTEAMQAMLPLRDRVDECVAPETAELFWTGLCALGTHGRLPSTQLVDMIERAERIYRRVGSPRRVHLGLYRKGFGLLHLGRCAEAQRSAQEMESLEATDWPAKVVALRLNLQAGVDGMLGRFEESIDAFTRAARLLQFERGEDDFVLNTLANLCLPLLCTERHEEALQVARDVLRRSPTPAVRNSAQRALLIALTFLGRLDEASSAARRAMRDWRSDDMLPHMLSVFAWLALQQGRTADAVRLDGAARLQVQQMGLSNTPIFDRAGSLVWEALNDRPCTNAELARWRAEGERANEGELVELCLGDHVDPAPDPIDSSARPSISAARSEPASGRLER
ncbi:MAG TPA: winged helix-turn-helix domain-containing protein [Caldimonas sp.]|jgi:predicted ATPase/DNA-binding winged helix-turn-helix (wHTH) protein